MVLKKRTAAAARRTPSKRRKSHSATGPALKTVSNQLAVRYREGQGGRVRKALEKFGTIEPQEMHRVLILHGAADAKKVETAVRALDDAVDFVTPVLVEPDSQTRQVPTDEIIIRLKPGRTRSTLATLAAEHGVEVQRRNAYEPTQYILKVPGQSGTHTLKVARSLDERPDVEFAAPNFLTQIKR